MNDGVERVKNGYFSMKGGQTFPSLGFKYQFGIEGFACFIRSEKNAQYEKAVLGK
jgi:hypothetical protein